MAEITIRPYNTGDEEQILDLLNRCYGEWGNLQKWRAFYTNYPNFTSDDIFIIENCDEIVGHRGLHFRDVKLNQVNVNSTVTLGDTAIHPSYRKHGLYTNLHYVTLEAAKNRGAILAFTWNLKGSTTYNNNKKTGFVEIRQLPTYMKVINPGKVLKTGISDFVFKNQRMRNTIVKLRTDIIFVIGETEFSVAELLAETDQQLEERENKVSLTVDENAISLLTNFRAMNSLERFRSLVSLLLYRKVKVRFSSIGAFWEVARKGVAIIGSL